MELQQGSKTELYQIMLARYYSASLGRFRAVDPGDDTALEDPQSWNKYAYVRNRPTIGRDPDGREFIIDNEAGWRQFREMGRMSLDSSDLKAEMDAHACEDCPYLRFAGEKTKLRDDNTGKPAAALTTAEYDGKTGEYEGSTITTNPDVLHKGRDERRTLLWEMGKVNYYRTDPEDAKATRNRKDHGDYQSWKFRKNVEGQIREHKRNPGDRHGGSVAPRPMHRAINPT